MPLEEIFLHGYTTGMAKNSPDDLLTVADAASVLKVSPRQVRNIIADGLLPAKKIGRDFVVKRSDLASVPDRKPGPKPGRPRKGK